MSRLANLPDELFVHSRLESIVTLVTRLFAPARPEGAQTIAEYALLIGLIALIVIVAGVLLGSSISSVFNTTAHKV